jgi:hypothetical protein
MENEQTEKEMAGVYEHAYALFIALCRRVHGEMFHEDDSDEPILREVWRSKLDDEHFILGFNTTGGGNVQYLVPHNYWDTVFFAKTIKDAPEQLYTIQETVGKLLSL